jgi:hypothetical protein
LAVQRKTQAELGYFRLEGAVHLDNGQVYARLPEPFRPSQSGGHNTDENQRDQGDHTPGACTFPGRDTIKPIPASSTRPVVR